ncbi:Riboflavin biosynthesis protein RibF [Corynebacterium caspium DSM 44850]|nr:Riboflavin biosynthesis protein RibF [Corynebacterium caspium DSM 44850]
MVTFDPHPVAVFLPQQGPAQLTTMPQRLAYAEKLGIDKVLIIDFTRELAGLSPQHYYSALIQDTLKARAVYVGENFTFGKDSAGTAETLQELGDNAGIETHIVGLVAEEDEVLCSSLVRKYLDATDVVGASWVLGRPFSVTAKIVHGAGRGGKTLGFPTANQYFPETVALPADGVYAGWITITDSGPIEGTMEAGKRYMAAVSVGTNPTFGADPHSVESFVIGQEANLYGHTATVEFIDFLRPMTKFSSIDELIATINCDVQQATEILKRSSD